VVTADHGESLGANHKIGHGLATVGETHIPLIMHFPGDKGAGRRIEGLVDLTDVLPTVMDICHVPVPWNINGRSRLSMIESPGTPGRDYVLLTYEWRTAYIVWDGEWRREVDYNPLILEFRAADDWTISNQEIEELGALGYLN
jgi:arylsulfatase A-like enzyme